MPGSPRPRRSPPYRAAGPPGSLVDLRAYHVRVSVAQLVEDLRSTLPRIAGRVGPARGAVGVAEVVERVRLEAPVVEVLVEVQGAPVGRDRRREVAQVVVGVADAVEGVRLGVPVADLLQEV